MHRWLFQLLSVCLGAGAYAASVTTIFAAAETPKALAPAQAAVVGDQRKTANHIYVIPVREQIGSAVHYIVRRGIGKPWPQAVPPPWFFDALGG